MTSAALTPPDYSGASNIGIVPALTWREPTQTIPDEVCRASASVLLVLDSLGWEQLRDRREVAPNLHSLSGGAATTVAPSTTAAALTSISTGVPPGEHGIVGYRFPAGGSVMNALRWTSGTGDHRGVVAPRDAQPVAQFAGGKWAVVGNRQFASSAFTEAYLGDAPYHGHQHPSAIAADVREVLDAGETLVYAYYDGLDQVAHTYGLETAHFDLELGFCDWLVGRLLSALPSGTSLVVSADHGQVQAPELISVDDRLDPLIIGLSGEPRFRWLHAAAGAASELASAAEAAHGDQACVLTVDEVIDRGWLGPKVTGSARSRLGDVALVATAPLGFADPDEAHMGHLVGRHGSLTAPEMLVPILHGVA